METRIVTLGPTGATMRTEPYDFEDAFGEYEEFSEARGRGRARRQARAMDRIAKRKERKTARIQARDEVRSARKQKRIARKADAQRARQEKRQSAMERRQTRKTTRRKMRLERKALGDEPGAEMDDQTALEMDDQNTQGPPPRTLPPDTLDDQGGGSFGDDSDSQGGGYSGGGAGSTIYAEDEEQAPNMTWGDEYSEGDEYSPSDYDYSETGEGEGDEVYSEDDSGFNGEIGNKKVNAKLLEIAKKIEWNKEMKLRLEYKKLDLVTLLKNTPVGPKANQLKEKISKIDNEIAQIVARIQQLEALLGGLNFSGADGQVRMARRMAKRQRAKVSIANRGRGRKLGLRKRVADGGDVTPVDSELNPDIRSNYIRVPSKSNFVGTGLIGIDDKDAYDADEPRVVELKSNASGDSDKNRFAPGSTTSKVVATILMGALVYFVVKGLTKKQ
jgi:hypothetical protein